jgi:hypothetical protein
MDDALDQRVKKAIEGVENNIYVAGDLVGLLRELNAARLASLAHGKARMAPVQGFAAGIPWSLHLEAYGAYCKQYRPQPALIEGNCRGGFDVEELDDFIPGWRDKVSEIGKLRAALDAATQQRDTLVSIIADAAGWSDHSYAHAVMHITNLIYNLKADARVAAPPEPPSYLGWHEKGYLADQSLTVGPGALAQPRGCRWCGYISLGHNAADRAHSEECPTPNTDV